MVGMSGAVNQRSSEVTAIGRTLPARACAITVGMLPKVMCTWPPITSVSAGPPPLYGMCSMSVPVIALNISPDRCSEVPCPDDAKAYLPGSFFSRRIRSCTVLTGRLLLTTSRFGKVPVMDTGAKSRRWSKGIFA